MFSLLQFWQALKTLFNHFIYFYPSFFVNPNFNFTAQVCSKYFTTEFSLIVLVPLDSDDQMYYFLLHRIIAILGLILFKISSVEEDLDP